MSDATPGLPSAYVAADWSRAHLLPAAIGAGQRIGRVRHMPDPTGEHRRAAALVSRAREILQEQFDALRRGGGVDLPAVRAITRDVARSITRNRYALIGLTRLRTSHEYTYVHSIAVSALMIGIGRELGLPDAEVEAVGLAGMLHDVGKSHVPQATLDKPGPLTPDEWATVKTHPERGHAILRKLEGVDPIVLDVALHHHERTDGGGYPHQLAGGTISVHARIAAVCDVYDALTSRRAYKEARPPAVVLDKMTRADGQFDPRMLRALRALVGAFPPGTAVRLQRGQIAVVLDEVAADPLSPRVRIVRHAETGRALEPVIVATRDNPVVSVERAEQWQLDAEALASLATPSS